MDYFALMKGFLLSPVDTFRKVRDTDLGDSLRYYLILLVINAVLTALVMLAIVNTTWVTISEALSQAGLPLPSVAGAGVIFVALALIVFQLVFVFIGAAWLHLFVWLLGGRKGYLQTLKAVTFGATPSMLFGWIPVIGILAGLWSLVLEVLGIRELQEITTARAILAVVCAILVVLVILVVVAAFFLIAYSQVSPGPVTVVSPITSYIFYRPG